MSYTSNLQSLQILTDFLVSVPVSRDTEHHFKKMKEQLRTIAQFSQKLDVSSTQLLVRLIERKTCTGVAQLTSNYEKLHGKVPCFLGYSEEVIFKMNDLLAQLADCSFVMTKDNSSLIESLTVIEESQSFLKKLQLEPAYCEDPSSVILRVSPVAEITLALSHYINELLELLTQEASTEII